MTSRWSWLVAASSRLGSIVRTRKAQLQLARIDDELKERPSRCLGRLELEGPPYGTPLLVDDSARRSPGQSRG